MRHEIRHEAALSPRAATFVGIAALHVCFAYLFVSGLAQSALAKLNDPLQVVEIAPAERPKPPAPPAVKPTFHERIVIDVPPPADPIPYPPEDTVTAAYEPNPTSNAGTAAVMPPPAEPVRLVGTNHIPNAETYYPASLKRQGIEGATVVRACVDERGHLQGEPTVTRSSGHEAFDKGALEAAREGRYARATRGGRPIPHCHHFKMTFVISSR